MADKVLGVETIRELQIWIDGKFELVAQSQSTTHNDLALLRGRVHDMGNEVAKQFAAHGIEIDALKTWRASLTAIKTAYAVGGTFFGGVIVLVLDLLKIIHP